MKVHPELEIVRISYADYQANVVEIKVNWVDEYGETKRSSTRNLMEGDVIKWKKFSKEYDF